VPTVSLVTTAFTHDHAAASRNYGMPGYHPHVIVEHPVAGLDRARVMARIERVIETIVRELTEPLSVPAVIPAAADDADVRLDCADAWQDAQKLFADRGWTDGLPIVPPTEEAVATMLGGTHRAPDEVVAILTPGLGRATVQKIAVNAVMAGSEPAQLPLIIAAVEAIADERFTLHTIAQSTTPSAPLFLVNGPIIQRLGLNFGTCALGPGLPSRPNIVIGRALRLCMMNLGHAYPQRSDMDTIGSPLKFSLVLPEHEAASPWQPYHVEHGSAADESVVTAFPLWDMRAASDLKSGTPELVLQAYVGELATMATARFANTNPPFPFGSTPLIVFPPDHARIFREAGWTKDDVRKFLAVHATVPGWRYAYSPTAFEDVRRWAPKVSPFAEVSVLEYPERLQLAVAGGPGCIGFVCPAFGHCVSRTITV
jgi:hypothetical protein